jgi:hypothetical protein
MAPVVEGFPMSAVLSLLQSRLLRPVFVTLGIALLVQVLVAVALTRSTVTALEADLGNRLGVDSQKLSGELAQAGKEVTSSLDSLSSSTRQRLTAGLSARLQEEQKQLRATLEKDLQDSANDMAQLLASVALAPCGTTMCRRCRSSPAGPSAIPTCCSWSTTTPPVSI